MGALQFVIRLIAVGSLLASSAVPATAKTRVDVGFRYSTMADNLVGLAIGSGLSPMLPISAQGSLAHCLSPWCGRATVALSAIRGHQVSAAFGGGRRIEFERLTLDPTIGLGVAHFGPRSLVPMVSGRVVAGFFRIDLAARIEMGSVSPMFGVSWDIFPAMPGFALRPAQDLGVVVGVSFGN